MSNQKQMSFLSDDITPEEALKRNEKLAEENKIELSDSKYIFNSIKEESKDKDDRLWRIIFDLIDELKLLKGEKG